MARNEKKQLQAKRIDATPANSSKCVLPLILVIFNEVIIIKENPKRLLDAFNICGDFFSIYTNLFKIKHNFPHYQIFKKDY